MKRLKDGFQFISNKSQNDYIDIFILILSIILIFLYFYIGNYNNITLPYLFTGLFLFVLIVIPLLQRSFNIYHKQKLQTKALKDYEQELSETKQKLATALEEKQKLVKSNHEFYHRQAALNKKLDDLRNQNQLISNAEFAEEYSNILNRINNLSAEYDIKTYTIPNLTKTNIVEIDDMLLYMQSECVKNNIEFIFKLECDINYIIENFISKSQLETLLGDLIRNAIIAINYSSNNFKSIMIVLGIKDEAYELSIFDSGIEFEIETLLNLGIQPSSTHLNDGGTGIGFITTFETLHSCNASFIINEITNNNYTKSLEIRFDNKNEYIIVSNRKEKINEMNKSNRNIILK
ncbi:MAG: HAMP domain-containing histidine kinase [Clostridia bacterium]|nr:HAMP domain-containing histidine kinase [Clostridia bacterium]